jgi:DNA mismatch repair protein MutH
MIKNGRSLSKEEILVIADSLRGVTFKEISYKIGNKGGFGLVIEEEVFGINANSNPEPDFQEANIELKVTPYKKNKNGTLSAKERLVLNIINYNNENLHDFYQSSFWKKNETMLIIFYLFEEDKEKRDFMITNHLLHQFSENDLQIIKEDWQTIVDKIENGEAHNISESDTLYLGACTKGVNSQSLVTQPFSSFPAKQRAYSLKTTYMTHLIRKLMTTEKIETIFKEKIESSFENQMRIRLKRFFGKTQDELKSMLNVVSNAKNINELLLSRMLGLKGKVSKSEEFLKANIVPKTVRVEEDGRVIESMSFPTFEFSQIVNETWDDSENRDYFERTKFLFIIFKKVYGVYVFSDIKLWNLPLRYLDYQVKNTWETTKKLISEGKIIKEIKNGRKMTYFPDKKDNGICHVRPHAKNAEDTYDLPISDVLTGARKHTKQCFWLNNTYISYIVSRES